MNCSFLSLSSFRRLLRPVFLGVLPLLLPACGVWEPTNPYATETRYLGAGGQVHTQPGLPPGGQPGLQPGVAQAMQDTISYWDDHGIVGPPSVRIELGAQRAYFYKGGHLVGVSQISTGREGYNTPSGSYRIQEKSPNHKSNLYGNFVNPATGQVVVENVSARKDAKPPGTVFDGASMPYFMRINGGVGMHAGFLPGFPASHGCIRMPEKLAMVFFNNVQVGTPVAVVP